MASSGQELETEMTGNSHSWASVDEIAAEVIACERCALFRTRTLAVPGDGSPSAAVLFIGEGPGQNEDEQGLPFIGRAGKLLDQLLAEVPLRRSDVFITNVVKCRPPGNRDPEPDEVAACMPYLKAQIELIDPRVIVTLGRHSMLRFYPEGKISNDHGRIIPIGSRVLLPLYHPAAILRNPRLNEPMLADIKRIPEAVRESLLLRRPTTPTHVRQDAETHNDTQPLANDVEQRPLF
jgi:uracil-DNA glycosylase family 4